jgi:ornithine carbamoyltransferase
MASPNLLVDTDISAVELNDLLALASDVKARPRAYAHNLAGRYIALLFEKPSLRTRVTFELAIKQLGGGHVFQDHRDGRIGEREPVRDMARNLDRWVDAIVARTFAQGTLDELAKWSSVPVINALSESYHPCQALADYFTLYEKFGSLKGKKLAYIGDGNNVCHSLLLTGAKLGVSVTVAGAPGYEPDPDILATAREIAAGTGASIEVTTDAIEAVRDAIGVYTDVWTSMGWEEETQRRNIAFAAYQVTDAMMDKAGPGALFMHCLPAQRGQEVTHAVIESERSVVFDQAENRLHAQKALLLMMISPSSGDPR